MAMEATNIATEAAGPFKELLSSEFVSKMEEKVSSFAENIPWLMNVLDEVTALHPAIQGTPISHSQSSYSWDTC